MIRFVIISLSLFFYNQLNAQSTVKQDTATFSQGIEYIAPIKILAEQSSYSFFEQANIQYGKGNPTGALTLVNKPHKEDPINFDYLLLRSYVLIEIGKYSDALSIAEQTIVLKPTDWKPIYCRAFCKYAKKDFLGSVVDYSTVINMKTDNSLAYYSRGMAKMELNDYFGAKEDFNLSIMLKPTYIEAYHGRGLAGYKVQAYEEAEKDFSSLIVKNPNSGEAFYYRGMCKIGLNELTNACLDFDKAIKMGYSAAIIEQKKNCGK